MERDSQLKDIATEKLPTLADQVLGRYLRHRIYREIRVREHEAERLAAREKGGE